MGDQGPFSCYLVDGRACVGTGDDESAQYCADLFVDQPAKKLKIDPSPKKPAKSPSEKIDNREKHTAPAKGTKTAPKTTPGKESSALESSASRPVELKGMTATGGHLTNDQ